MIRRTIAALLVVAGSGLFFVGSPADAADIVSTGWWSRVATNDPLSGSPQPLPVPRPTTPDTVPVGATVGGDQLLVEGTPDGATAVAAIRWTLADGESSPTLTLPISPGSTVSPASLILACRAATLWEPPESVPGRWEAKPVVDDSACINGIVADNASAVAFGLQPLVRKQVLDVVLVPGRLAEAPQLPVARVDGSSFRWVFEAPTLESLQVVEGSGYVEGAGPVFVTPPPGDDTALDVAPQPGLDPSAVVAPVLPPTTMPTPVTATVPGVTPTLEPDELASADIAEQAGLVTDTGGSTTVGLVLLLLGAAFAAWAHLSPEPELTAIGLGRFRRVVTAEAGGPGPSPDTLGGLGRFARPRSEPPVRIG